MPIKIPSFQIAVIQQIAQGNTKADRDISRFGKWNREISRLIISNFGNKGGLNAKITYIYMLYNNNCGASQGTAATQYVAV